MLENLLLPLLIALFGVGCLILVFLVMRVKPAECSWGEYSTRILIIILVVIVGGVVVSSPLSAEKVAGLLTLFGVIAGYVLGSWGKVRIVEIEKKKEKEKEKEKEKKKE